MTKYSTQETFDTVAKHLLRQSKKSMTSCFKDAYCAYRGSNGCRCAAGCLIPDHKYNREFEKLSASDLVATFDLVDFFGHAVDLVEELQACHDSVEVDAWQDGLRKIGMDWELDCSVLNKFEWDAETQRYQEST